MAEVLLLHVLTQGSQSLRARAAELCAARNVLVDPSAPSEGGEGSPPQGGAPGGAVRLSTEDRRRLLGVLCVPPSPRGAKDVWGDLTEAGDAGGASGGASGAADELLYQLERPGDEHMYMAGLWESEARAAYAGSGGQGGADGGVQGGADGGGSVGEGEEHLVRQDRLVRLCIDHIAIDARYAALRGVAGEARAQLDTLEASVDALGSRDPWLVDQPAASADRAAAAAAAGELVGLAEELAAQAEALRTAACRLTGDGSGRAGPMAGPEQQPGPASS